MGKMNSRSTRGTKSKGKAHPAVKFDTDKFENTLQIGGIQTAMLESPSGSGHYRRVALVNTGSPLRFTVALDRGGDIVDAFHGRHSLTYLTCNGIKAPSHAYHAGADWLFGWPAGLMTTCGPEFMGPPREEEGKQIGVHGHHSNTPAAVEMLINPDPHRGRHEMLITMTVRDTRMFGPYIEVRRTIVCSLGMAEIRIFDEVTNRGNQRCSHSWLYHVNLGYPLLDEGAQLIYGGKTKYFQNPPEASYPTDAQLNRMKRVSGPMEEHVGDGERCLLVDTKAHRDGLAHVGLVNSKLNLGIELLYPPDVLPRFCNWHHFGPRGSYVCGIEPYSGTLVGKNNDDHPLAVEYLQPDQTKRYQLTIRVHDTTAALSQLRRLDRKLTSR